MDYPAAVLERFDAPAHAGRLSPGPGTTVTGRAGDLAEGILVAFEARIDAGHIAGVAFRAYGCPHTIAACSLVAERLRGLPATALTDFDLADVAADLDLPPEKRGRLLRIEDALRMCGRDWDNKRLSASSASRSDP
jgi:NifU-like protein involved in Fe-S cluster formation